MAGATNTYNKEQYPILYNIVWKQSAPVADVLNSNPLNAYFRRALVGNRFIVWKQSKFM